MRGPTSAPNPECGQASMPTASSSSNQPWRTNSPSTARRWLDDVHFQSDVSNLYRRDFQNGIVLVNPSGIPMSVPLERPFRKIAGSVSPDVNDGSSVSNVTVPPSDALFLIGDDVTPPAAVTNLRASP